MVPDPKSQTPTIDSRPDAWERFEHAVDAAVKAGPKHRKAEKDQLRMMINVLIVFRCVRAFVGDWGLLRSWAFPGFLRRALLFGMIFGPRPPSAALLNHFVCLGVGCGPSETYV